MISVSGIKIPSPAFLDARIYTLGGENDQYISSIRVTSSSVYIAVSDRALGEVAVGELKDGDTLYLFDSFDRPSGVIKLNANILRTADKIPFDLEFTPVGLSFCGSCVVPQPDTGVTGLLSDNHLMYGDVTLIGEEGVVLKRSGNDIKVHIIGDRLSVRRACEKDDPDWEPPRPIKEIVVNGDISLLPDEFGNISLFGGANEAEDNVIRITPTETGISIKILGNFD